MDIIHQKLLLFMVICLDVVNNTLKELVVWFAVLPPLAAAILTITIFIATAGLILSSALIFRFPTTTHIVILDWLLQLLALLAYYCGDNIPYILQEYSDTLNCHSSCQAISRCAAIVLLVFSLMVQYGVPHKQQRQRESKEGKSEGPKAMLNWWICAFDIAKVFFTAGIVYTIVVMATFNSKYSLTIKALVFTICVAVGCFSIAMNFLYSQKGSGHKEEKAFTFITVFLAISLPFYLLTDNESPRSWNLNCQFNASNSSLEEESTYSPEEVCHNQSTTQVIWLVFHAIPAAALVAIIGFFVYRRCK